MYNLSSIDKWIYLFDHYLHENIELFYRSIKFPPNFFHSILSSLVPDKHRFAFYHFRLVLLVLEFRVNGIIEYALFCVSSAQDNVFKIQSRRYVYQWFRLFYLLNGIPLYVSTTDLFRHSLVNGHLGCFWFWPTMNKEGCYEHSCTSLWVDIYLHLSWENI